MSKSRTVNQKQFKIAGAGAGREADFISPRKVGAYIVLYESIKDRLGSYGEADKAINIKAHRAISEMRNKRRLSAFHARLILDCFNKLTK